jgi:hypothetical protein
MATTLFGKAPGVALFVYGMLSLLMSDARGVQPSLLSASSATMAPFPYLLLQQSTSPGDLSLTPESFDRSVWAAAKPYLDDPLPQLIVRIPELHGLEPSADQQLLADILKKTGEQSLNLLKRMPNVICHEKVFTKAEPRGPSWHQQFEYLVLRHETAGEIALEEYRTDKSNSGTAPLTRGNANAWVLFHRGNLAESRFRFLGHQSMDGHSTLVLAFAQIPDKVRSPGQVSFAGTTIAVLFQGIAWIDESDFRIVRLHKDLLAPRPDIYLRALSSDVLFGEVRLPKVAETLWLPREVKTTWDFKGEVVDQVNQYSRFRLYAAKSKILM